MGEESGRLTVTHRSSSETRPGLRVRWPRSLVAVGVALVLGSAGTSAQERPDTLPPDTALAAQERPDTLPADTVSIDTVYYNLPDLDRPTASGWEAGVWVWDRDDIGRSGAFTLYDLFLEVPGILPLLAGDYGTPAVVTAFGMGGGRIRVLRDGFEVVPLEGGVPDFTRIGLAGIGRVRLVRGGTELRVELTSFEHADARPYSLIEAANGDLNTNFFRGAFVSPHSLGGSLAVGLERADSRGARGDEPGQRTGSWLRYQLHRGDAAGLAVDFRRVDSDTEAEAYAAEATRTDWTVRGRARFRPQLTAEMYYGRSIHDVRDSRDAYTREGGTRTQLGSRAIFEAGGLRAAAAYRRHGGDELPHDRLELGLEGEAARVGGLSAGIDRATWGGTSATTKRVRAWTRAVAGFSLFGSWESGTTGARLGPLLDRVPPVDSTATEEPDTAAVEPESLFAISDRKATRLGGTFSWRGWTVSGARLRLEADSLLPLGLEPDRGTPPLEGGVRSGWEVRGALPVPIMPGLVANGSMQQWEEGWSYLPERIYQASLDYHRTFLATGNFELWWSLGVRGRDPMTVRQVLSTGEGGDGETAVELATVPFAQNWYGRIQARIVTVRIFIAWENFTVRRNLQDFPDRLLPQTRAVYGLRWTMWN